MSAPVADHWRRAAELDGWRAACAARRAAGRLLVEALRSPDAAAVAGAVAVLDETRPAVRGLAGLVQVGGLR